MGIYITYLHLMYNNDAARHRSPSHAQETSSYLLLQTELLLFPPVALHPSLLHRTW